MNASVPVIREEGGLLKTVGLVSAGHPEIVVRKPTANLDRPTRELLGHLAKDVMQRGAVFRDGETLELGYWLLRFTARGSGLELWERTADGERHVEGCELAAGYWQAQHEVCAQAGAEFSPPRPDQRAAVSPGVLEGKAVDGVRYPAPPHMSGWWFLADDFQGDTSCVTVHHLVHISARRPDLAPYLALPHGFRFTQRAPRAPWFDQEVAARAIPSDNC